MLHNEIKKMDADSKRKLAEQLLAEVEASQPVEVSQENGKQQAIAV